MDAAIPGLKTSLRELGERLVGEANRIEAELGQSGTELSLLLELGEQLASFAEKPASIPRRLDAFKGNITALGTWVASLREQPLELDYIELYPAGEEASSGKAGWWDSLVFGVQAFAASFVTDYSMVGVMAGQEGWPEASPPGLTRGGIRRKFCAG